MLIREIIKFLETLDQDEEIYISNCESGGFSSLNERHIRRVHKENCYSGYLLDSSNYTREYEVPLDFNRE